MKRSDGRRLGGVPLHSPADHNLKREEKKMAKKQVELTVVQKIQSDIIQLPGRPLVMLTREVAELYEVTPRRIAQAVQRNQDRFPERYVFRLTEKEIEILKSGIQNEYRLSNQATETPLAFTREGANMLSAVLRSKVAVERSIQIMDAFTALEREAERFRTQNERVRNQRAINKNNPEWVMIRENSKLPRREFTDAIAALEKHILSVNPGHRRSYYGTYTEMEYKQLFILEGKKIAKNFRDLLDGIQLTYVGIAEALITEVIYDGLANGIEYHEIFKIAKAKIEAFVAVIGKTVPGNHKALRPAPLALAR